MAASQKVVRPMDGNLTVLNFALDETYSVDDENKTHRGR
jgi:hypothetical protein